MAILLQELQKKNEKHREGVHDAFLIIMSERDTCGNRLIPCGGVQGLRTTPAEHNYLFRSAQLVGTAGWADRLFIGGSVYCLLLSCPEFSRAS